MSKKNINDKAKSEWKPTPQVSQRTNKHLPTTLLNQILDQTMRKRKKYQWIPCNRPKVRHYKLISF